MIMSSEIVLNLPMQIIVLDTIFFIDKNDNHIIHNILACTRLAK